MVYAIMLDFVSSVCSNFDYWSTFIFKYGYVYEDISDLSLVMTCSSTQFHFVWQYCNKTIDVLTSSSSLLALQLMAEVRSSSSGFPIAPEVAQLVDYVWEEASGQLSEILAVPEDRIKTEDLDKAEAALLSIRRALEQGSKGAEGEGEGE